MDANADKANGALGQLRTLVRRRPLVSALVAVSVACVVSIVFFDKPIAQFYRFDARPEVFTAFKYFSGLANVVPYFAVAAILLLVCRLISYYRIGAIVRDRVDRISNACVFFVLSVAISGIAVNVMKVVIGRPRPKFWLQDGTYAFQPFSFDFPANAFPSGHSQAIWAIAISLVLIYPRYDLAYVAIAVLVSASRFITYDHYLADVLFGSFLGIASPILVKQYVFDRRGVPFTFDFRMPPPASPDDRDGGARVVAYPPSDEKRAG